MIDLGFPWTAGGYSSESESANLIIDQFNVMSQDNHHWYHGNNTNFPALWVKAGGYQATSGTGAVMNSDWINIGAVASTNNPSLPRMAFIGVASNEDFLAIWQSIGMSTNGATVGTHYSTNATDHLQFGTNRFAGWLFGRNKTFGAGLTNMVAVLLRDETNGLQVLSASTNNGGSVYLGPTNNLQQALISGGATSNISISGSTFYYTNGLLQGVTTP
jgi:hypothetical protein